MGNDGVLECQIPTESFKKSGQPALKAGSTSSPRLPEHSVSRLCLLPLRLLGRVTLSYYCAIQRGTSSNLGGSSPSLPQNHVPQMVSRCAFPLHFQKLEAAFHWFIGHLDTFYEMPGKVFFFFFFNLSGCQSCCLCKSVVFFFF